MMGPGSWGVVGLLLVSLCGALASNGQLGNLRRMLQQQESSSGAVAGDNSGADVPGCRTPWETFNSTAELSFWAEALQTVGFADEVHSPYITATFLVPTNDAFAALLHSLGSTKQQLLANPSIVPILLYHMLPGTYMPISDFELDDDLASAINLNLTVGSASAPLVAAPGLNSTVVTVRSAQSVADIVKYNITSCMAMVHELDQVLVPEFLWADSGPNQVVYHMGDGSGSHAVITNFTLILPGGDARQTTADGQNPMYQITEAGLMFSVVSAPD